MIELITNAQAAIERLECEDWEVGPFDGHCLRLTCTRCLFQMVVRELTASRAREAALVARVEALTAAASRGRRMIELKEDQALMFVGGQWVVYEVGENRCCGCSADSVLGELGRGNTPEEAIQAAVDSI